MKQTIFAIGVALAATWLISGVAIAKGPFEVEVSGGNLDAPMQLGGKVAGESIFPEHPQYIDEPLSYTDNIYTLTFGDRGETIFTLSYYPEHDGVGAALRDEDGSFRAVPDDLAELLEDAPLAASAASEGDSGASIAWLALPALLGVVVVGGGAAGIMRRRRG